MKIFERFVRTLYWLQVVAAPVLLFGLISLIVYSKTENKIVAIILFSLGVLGEYYLQNLSGENMGLRNSLQTFTDRLQ